MTWSKWQWLALPVVFVALVWSATFTATVDGTAVQAPSVRFHHLHYRVVDPGEALGDAASAFGGVRTILQGLGVGVRVQREYVLFDRELPASRVRAPGAVAGVYERSVRWLISKGLTVAPQSLGANPLARPVIGQEDAVLDHIAFAADDLASIVARVKAKPILVTPERAVYRIGSGLHVEIVRDTDRPDAWWCPMHPDVRAPDGGSCPLCKMALVPIPPPRIGEYRMDVVLTPRAGGGASGASITIRDPDTGEPVTNFLEVHERPFHLFIVSRDLSTFAHEHPVRGDEGEFRLAYDIAPGEYMLIADFLPASGTSQLVQRAVVTPGFDGALFTPPVELLTDAREQDVSGLRIKLEYDRLRPRRESVLRFVMSDSDTGLPAIDLEPYLGAAGHALIVSADLATAIHGHPETQQSSGPTVMFAPVFPQPGAYKVWVQFQRRSRVITAAFTVTVPEG
jgi:hypothetical protein